MTHGSSNLEDSHIKNLALCSPRGVPRPASARRSNIFPSREAPRLVKPPLPPQQRSRPPRLTLKEHIFQQLRERPAIQRIIRPVFRQLDEDRTGVVSHEKFAAGLRRLGVRNASGEELLELAREVDRNGRGCINYGAFATRLFESEPDASAAGAVSRKIGGESGADSAGAVEKQSGRQGKEGGESSPAAPMRELAPPAPSALETKGSGSSREEVMAARAARKQQLRERGQVQQTLNLLCAKLEAAGSIATVFGKFDGEMTAKIEPRDFQAALGKLGIPASAELSRKVLLEFDIDSDGEVEYREFAQRLLAKMDVDNTGARGSGGGRDAQRRASFGMAQKENGIAPMDRHAAVLAINRMRERISRRSSNGGYTAAFLNIDCDRNGVLSYPEFTNLLLLEMPEVSTAVADAVCRIVDSNGDGVIDLSEFSAMMEASKASETLRASEQSEKRERFAQGPTGGRFGATPTLSYGVEMFQLLRSFPGAACYLNEEERFEPVGLRPGWQGRDRMVRLQRSHAKHEEMRRNRSCEAHKVAQLERKADMKVEARLDALFQQNLLYSRGPQFKSAAGSVDMSMHTSAQARPYVYWS